MFPGPVVPYIREADFAVRTPWYTPPRRLLDYLLLYVQEGECQVVVEGEELLLGGGDFCLIQSNTLHSLRGLTETITPYATSTSSTTPDGRRASRPGAGKSVSPRIRI